jgi:hypothetical protein
MVDKYERMLKIILIANLVSFTNGVTLITGVGYACSNLSPNTGYAAYINDPVAAPLSCFTFCSVGKDWSTADTDCKANPTGPAGTTAHARLAYLKTHAITTLLNATWVCVCE